MTTEREEVRSLLLQPNYQAMEDVGRRMAESMEKQILGGVTVEEGVLPTVTGGYTRADLLWLHEQTCKQARDLMAEKNQDYGSVQGDVFRNFRLNGLVLGVDPRLAILGKMVDKLARLQVFVERGFLAVKDESVQDSAKDIINYAVLYLGMCEEEKQQQKPKSG